MRRAGGVVRGGKPAPATRESGGKTPAKPQTRSSIEASGRKAQPPVQQKRGAARGRRVEEEVEEEEDDDDDDDDEAVESPDDEDEDEDEGEDVDFGEALAAADNGEDDEEDEDEEDERPNTKKLQLMGDSESDSDADGGEEDEESGEEEEDGRPFRLTHAGERLDEDEEEEEDENGLREEEEEEELPTDEAEKEEEEEEDNLADRMMSAEAPSDVAARIKETAAALTDFEAYKKRTRKPASRSELMETLAHDCATYYGYLDDLIDMFMSLFGPAELVDFLEANEVARPVVIRTNTLKTSRRALAQALAARGVGLEPVAQWSDVGLKIFENNSVPIGATPEYLSGLYMLQSASSFAPVMALAPQPKERVLDMCAAPGGKTAHIAQLMKNTGLVVANDAKKPRLAALVANLARMGVRNAVCVNYDGREFPKVMGGFDRVLLDAPCSGLGVISHDPSVKQSRTIADIRTTAHLQKQLVLSAIDSCVVGGTIVYSTCSISPQENEQVVQYALEHRDVKLVDAGLDFCRPGLVKWQGHVFHPSMKLARRLYPHTHNMDGFFIAKLVKVSAGVSASHQSASSSSSLGGAEVSRPASKPSLKRKRKVKLHPDRPSSIVRPLVAPVAPSKASKPAKPSSNASKSKAEPTPKLKPKQATPPAPSPRPPTSSSSKPTKPSKSVSEHR